MPRRRPSTLRASAHSHAVIGPVPQLFFGTPRLHREVEALERERLWRGALAAALNGWTKLARMRHPVREITGCPICDHFYDYPDERTVLEVALHGLSPRAARELRAVVEPLDDLYRSKTWPDPAAVDGEPWWRRRCSE
jgi:hypothetical protein